MTLSPNNMGRLSCVVQKYGGSSVADLERIRGVARRIAATRAQGLGVVAVVSAMGNTTNELIALAHQVHERPDRRELDMLVSVGERISMALLAMALHELGVPARSLTGSQAGIITDESHSDARVVEVRPHRVLEHLEAGEVVLVAGFQGVSRARDVTTLGRGGSDTTAVVLAAAIGAQWCEICSDVDGVWSADPRVVSTAEKLDQMALREGLALAEAGAKVLFEDAVRYAADKGLELRSSSTFGPGTGTRLRTEGGQAARAMVTGDAQVVRVAGGPEAWAQAVAQGGRLRRTRGAEAWVDLRNAPSGLHHIEHVPVALVTLVRKQVGRDAEALGRLLSVVQQVPESHVGAWGAEADAVWFEVARAACDAVTNALHDAP